jgi:hypothetical protein
MGFVLSAFGFGVVARLDSGNVRIESGIGFSNQSLVEPFFAHVRLITTTKDDRLTGWVKGKREAPDSVGGVEAELLHVGVLRTVERVHARSTELWSELFKQFDLSQQLILYLLV